MIVIPLLALPRSLGYIYLRTNARKTYRCGDSPLRNTVRGCPHHWHVHLRTARSWRTLVWTWSLTRKRPNAVDREDLKRRIPAGVGCVQRRAVGQRSWNGTICTNIFSPAPNRLAAPHALIRQTAKTTAKSTNRKRDITLLINSLDQVTGHELQEVACLRSSSSCVWTSRLTGYYHTNIIAGFFHRFISMISPLLCVIGHTISNPVIIVNARLWRSSRSAVLYVSSSFGECLVVARCFVC